MLKKSMTLFAMGALISLCACGMKGGLIMPPGPAPEPLLGHAKPPPAEPSKSRGTGDVSTSKEDKK